MTLKEMAKKGYEEWRSHFSFGVPPAWYSLTEREQSSYIFMIEFTARQKDYHLFDGGESYLEQNERSTKPE